MVAFTLASLRINPPEPASTEVAQHDRPGGVGGIDPPDGIAYHSDQGIVAGSGQPCGPHGVAVHHKQRVS